MSINNGFIKRIGIESIDRIISLDPISFIDDESDSAILRTIILDSMNKISALNLEFFVKTLHCNNFNLEADGYEEENHPFVNSSVIDSEWEIIKSNSFAVEPANYADRDNINNYYTKLKNKIRQVFNLNDNFDKISTFTEISIKDYLKKQLTKNWFMAICSNWLNVIVNINMKLKVSTSF